MWRILATAPLALLSASAPPPSSIPDPSALGRALAQNNDWRAIVIIMVVVMFGLFGLVIWDRISSSRLHKSIDANTQALWAVKLALERVAAQKGIMLDQEPPPP